MQAILETPSHTVQSVETAAFQLVIAYEDSSCSKHAQRTVDHVISQLGNDVNVTKSEWKFEVLQSRSLRELASQDARFADMIIIAAHGDRELCPDLKSWIETWERSNRHRALVAVLRFDSSPFADSESNLNYLQDIARDNGMDFFAVELEMSALERE